MEKVKLADDQLPPVAGQVNKDVEGSKLQPLIREPSRYT
jgi:hypothetical protein